MVTPSGPVTYTVFAAGSAAASKGMGPPLRRICPSRDMSPPGMQPGEHILDHVLGRGLIPDQQQCQPDKLSVAAYEQRSQVWRTRLVRRQRVIVELRATARG